MPIQKDFFTPSRERLLRSSAIDRTDLFKGVTFTATDITERKRAEELLRVERDRAQQYLDIAGVMLIALNRQGNITLVNKKGCEILGCDSRDILGRNWFTHFLPPRARRQVGRVFAKIVRGEVEPAECVENLVLTANGQERLMAWHNTVLRDETGEIVGTLSSGEDITNRKRAEEALFESEAQYRRIVHTAQEGIWVMDKDCNTTFVNQRMVDMLGYTLAEMASLPVDAFIFEEDRQAYEEQMKARRQGRDATYERKFRRRDSSALWAIVSATALQDEKNEFCGSFAMFTDITERKHAEETLRESERQYRTVLNAMGDAIHVVGQDLRFVLLNRTFVDWNRKLNLATDVIGREIHEVFPFLPERVREEYSQVFRTGKTLITEECTPVHGQEILTETRKIPIFREGKVFHVVTVIRDITERRRAEEALLLNHRKLRSLASELSLAEERERRRIAVNLHDHACQSLVLAKMKAQTLLDGASPADTTALQCICESLGEAIDDIRELTFDLSSATLYKFGLEAALRELLKDKLAGQSPIEYQFVTDGKPKPLTHEVRVLLFQSVRELLINVVKHALARRVTVDVRRAGDFIEILVADDGIGFDADAVASSAYRNHSVGLFFVRERLDYTGGALRIDSRPGHGSRLTLTAPLDKRPQTVKENHDGHEDSARR